MTVIEFVKQTIPAGWKSASSGWISGNCPMCVYRGHRADTRKRGGILISNDSIQYNCFNCGFKASWVQGSKINNKLTDLLVNFGADRSSIQRINFELLKQEESSDIIKKLLPSNVPDEIIIDWKIVDLPPGSKKLSEVNTSALSNKDLESYISACQYIVDRGLDFYDNWHWTNYDQTPYKNFSKRIILPFYYRNKIVGFTARWAGSLPASSPTPKYFLSNPGNFVYNLDAQTANKYVIITEGPFDALIVNGISTNGNSPNRTQCKIIDQLHKEVIVLPDADSAGCELVDIAIQHGWAVSFPPWQGCKDANDAAQKYGRLFTVSSILNSVEKNSTKIKLLAKQYCR